MTIVLEGLKSSGFKEIGRGVTNADGRVKDIMGESKLAAGIYKMTFHTKDYLAGSERTGFYPYVEVVFEVTKPDEHHHIPLLLSPFGYSTYRGS